MFKKGFTRVEMKKTFRKAKEGYAGSLKIKGTEFFFEIVSGERIGEIQGMDPLELEKIIRDVVVIKIYKEGILIELDGKEYVIFYSILFPSLAVVGDFLKEFEESEAEIEDICFLSNSVARILGQPKFGCPTRYEDTILVN